MKTHKASVACLWFQCPDFLVQNHFPNTQALISLSLSLQHLVESNTFLWRPGCHDFTHWCQSIKSKELLLQLQKHTNQQLQNLTVAFPAFISMVGCISNVKSKRDNLQTNSFVCKINLFLPSPLNVPTTPIFNFWSRNCSRRAQEFSFLFYTRGKEIINQSHSSGQCRDERTVKLRLPIE